MRSASARRRVKEREVTDEIGNLRHYILTTHRNCDIEVEVNPRELAPVDIIKGPHRFSEEQARCALALCLHAIRLLNPGPELVATRRRVKLREVTDETGNLKRYVLTTPRCPDIEVAVILNHSVLVDVTRRPSRLTEEQTRCFVAVLQRALKLLAASTNAA
jgi:hypothetical protein